MKKATIFLNSLLAVALFLPASAVAKYVPAVPEELPEGITGVLPEQGRVFLQTVEETGMGLNTDEYLGLKQITVEFSSMPKANPDADGTIAIYKDGSETPFSTLPSSSATVDLLGYSWGTFFFPRDIKGNGNYHVVIPEGTWLVGSDNTPSPKIELNYVIYSTCTVNPTPGVVNELETITLEFPDFDEVQRSSGNIKCSSLSKDYTVSVDIPEVAEGQPKNKVVITVQNNRRPIMSAGECKLFVFANAFKLFNNGVEEMSNEAFFKVYNVSDFPKPEISPEEDSELEEIGDFVLTIDSNYQIVMVNDKGRSHLYAVEDGELGEEVLSMTAKYGNATNEVILSPLVELEDETWGASPDPIAVPAGEYCLELYPMLVSCFYDSDIVSLPAYQYFFTVVSNETPEPDPTPDPEPEPDPTPDPDPEPDPTPDPTPDPDPAGITTIEAPACSYTIYTLSGVPVAKNASSEVVANLSQGLYIINGKKIVVK
jgi:hypothetical protein